jgi:starch synthase
MAVPKTAALPLGDAPTRCTTFLCCCLKVKTGAIISKKINILQERDLLLYREVMRIVHLAAEFSPIAKAGGLGEVVLGLSRELTRQGHTVEVILPKYNFLNPHDLKNLTLETPYFKCLDFGNAMWTATVEECHLYLLEARHPSGYFHRGKIYGCEDDIARFTYFSRAALEYLKLKNTPIDVLHLHDWHVSFCAPLVKKVFRELDIKKIVLSIHNCEYQGKCARHDLEMMGFTNIDFFDDHPLYPTSVNLLKGGILHADGVAAVSPTYAEEILTPKFGCGLEKTLWQQRSKLTGVLNGIDEVFWNPASDPSIVAHFDPRSTLTSILKAKKANKEHLRKRFGLSKGLMMGAITRLVPQKGLELIEEAMNVVEELGGTFILLGSSPSPSIQAHFEGLKKKHEKSKRLSFQLQYDEALAHQLYAGLDFLIVPSHFEPCGLTQLIAMRYGTVPIVHSTGGLKDTVFDSGDYRIPIHRRNGFSFSPATKIAMKEAIERAFHLYTADPTAFQSLIRHGIQSDFSWNKPAKEYLKLYKGTLSLRKRFQEIDAVSIDVVENRNDCVDSSN